MDKSTLSNYGWIVIAVLVLSVMIALSTPFGHYVKFATLSTLNGLFDTEEKALDIIGFRDSTNDDDSNGTEDNENETVELEPGLYDKNDVLIASWDSLVNDYGVIVDKDYYVEIDGYWDYIDDYNNGNYPGAILNENEELNKGTKLVIGNVDFIGTDTFDANDTLETIIVSSSVKTIKDYAFASCTKLTTVKISNSVTEIGEGIFILNSNLKEVILPNNIKKISTGMFSDCYSLEKVEIPSSVTRIDEGAFFNCFNLKLIVPNTVTEIDICAFTEIGNVCYSGTAIDESGDKWGAIELHSYNDEMTVIIEESTCIKKGTKQLTCEICKNKIQKELSLSGHKDQNNDKKCDVCGCSLTPGLYDSNGVLLADWDTLVNTYGLQIENDYDSSTHKNGGSLKYILENNSNLSSATKLVIPNTVTRIGNEQVYNCDNITEVVIPDSVTEIGYSAFNDCSNLTNVKMSKNIKTIENRAFNQCKKLESVIIPGSVESLGMDAFGVCMNLTITFDNKEYDAYASTDFNMLVLDLGIASSRYTWTVAPPM